MKKNEKRNEQKQSMGKAELLKPKLLSGPPFSFLPFPFPQGISGEQLPPQWRTIFAKLVKSLKNHI
jgi:hypothetical protein